MGKGGGGGDGPCDSNVPTDMSLVGNLRCEKVSRTCKKKTKTPRHRSEGAQNIGFACFGQPVRKNDRSAGGVAGNS